MTQASRNQSKKAKPITKQKTAHHKASYSVTFTFNQIGIAAIIALLFINIALVAGYTKVQSVRNESNRVATLNDPLKYGDVSIEASNVQTEKGYMMGIVPSDDEKIVSVQLTIRNDSDEDFEFYPTAQSFIRDNQGTQYIMSPVDLRLPFAATTIKPGETKTGQLSYLVTNRVVPLFLYVESRQAGAGPFVIKIQ